MFIKTVLISAIIVASAFAGPRLGITTSSSLPSGIVGTPYSVMLTATGGRPPYSWRIASGKLPGGLGLNNSLGIISGDPTTAGAFAFTLAVTDAARRTVKRSYSIAIAAAPVAPPPQPPPPSPTPPTITPYLQINGAAWQIATTVTVTLGDSVNLGPQPLGGTWSWSGPNGFTSSLREIDAIPLTVGTDAFVATYTDPNTGLSNTQIFAIAVNASPVLDGYYVATNGNDFWSGLLPNPTGNDGPFATLSRAQVFMHAL